MHRSFAVAVPATVRALVVVIAHPFIQISLKLLQVIVQFFTESNGIKLLLHGSVEAFADAVGLRMADLRFAVLYAFNVQVKFILVVLQFALVFGTAISQYSRQWYLVLFKEWPHPVILEYS